MATSRKALREEQKEKYLQKLMDFFRGSEEVLRVKSNEIAFPIVDSEGNEDFLVLTVKIPIGSNKGTEPYDGYAMAEEYEMKLKSKAENKATTEKKKAEKIKRDEEYRRKKAEQKEKGE